MLARTLLTLGIVANLVAAIVDWLADVPFLVVAHLLMAGAIVWLWQVVARLLAERAEDNRVLAAMDNSWLRED